MHSSAQLLDYILQVSQKSWCDRALAGELVSAWKRACGLNFDNTAQGCSARLAAR